MSLILAIESDRRQAARITAIARDRLNVELIVTESAERALEALTALAGRTPDLILTPQLMSPRDEGALNDRLRALDAAGLHVQTLTIPVLASSGESASKNEGGLLKRLRRGKEKTAANEGGCDPGVFAAQISEYLKRAAEERAALSAQVEEEREYRASHPQPAPVVEAEARVLPQADGPEPFVYEPRFSTAEPAPVVESAAPEPDQTAEPEPFVYEPRYASSGAEPFAPSIEASPVASQVVAEEPAGGTAHFLSESALSSLELEPVSEVSKPVDAGEPRPDMIGFLDSMLDPAPDPVRPPDVSRIDVSAIVELDDLAVSDSNTSADELFYEEAIAARAPAEGLRTGPLPVEAFAKEVDDDIEKVTKPRVENTRDVLADFVEFDELGVMDGPSVALGEFEEFGTAAEDDAAFAKEAQSPRPAVSVLDLELLDDPEISHTIEASHRRDHRADAARATAALEAFFDEPVSEPAGSEFDFEGDLFTPLPVAAQRHWPRPEGPSVKSALFTAPAFDAPPDPGVEFAPMAPGAAGKKKKAPKPAQDEWGLFDPAQCGFAALLAKLDEVTDNEETEQHTR